MIAYRFGYMLYALIWLCGQDNDDSAKRRKEKIPRIVSTVFFWTFSAGGGMTISQGTERVLGLLELWSGECVGDSAAGR